MKASTLLALFALAGAATAQSITLLTNQLTPDTATGADCPSVCYDTSMPLIPVANLVGTQYRIGGTSTAATYCFGQRIYSPNHERFLTVQTPDNGLSYNVYVAVVSQSSPLLATEMTREPLSVITPGCVPDRWGLDVVTNGSPDIVTLSAANVICHGVNSAYFSFGLTAETDGYFTNTAVNYFTGSAFNPWPPGQGGPTPVLTSTVTTGRYCGCSPNVPNPPNNPRCRRDLAITLQQLNNTYVAFTSAGSAHWQSIGLVGFGPFLTTVILDQTGTVRPDGLYEYVVPELDATGTAIGYFRLTAFWVDDLDLAPEPVPNTENGGGHFHTSDYCELGCGGTRYEDHHAQTNGGRQGISITYSATNSPTAPRLPFSLAYIDYSNVAPVNSTLEVCVGQDATAMQTLADWQACSPFVFGAPLYTNAVQVNTTSAPCCQRLQFGCQVVPSNTARGGLPSSFETEGAEHLCLFLTVVAEANVTREFLNDALNTTLLIDPITTAFLNITNVTTQAYLAEIADFERYLANVTAELLAGAVAQYRVDMDTLLAFIRAAQNATRQLIADNTTQLAEQIRAQFLEEVRVFNESVDNATALFEQAVIGLTLNILLSEQIKAVADDANAQSAANQAALEIFLQLLEAIPNNIETVTDTFVEVTEKDILLAVLRLKKRLRSMDGERKDLLDQIKGQITINRIKLERTIDFTRRLSDTSDLNRRISSETSKDKMLRRHHRNNGFVFFE